MKWQDLREAVMRMINEDMSSVGIAKQLRNVVSERTVRRWKNLYKKNVQLI